MPPSHKRAFESLVVGWAHHLLIGKMDTHVLAVLAGVFGPRGQTSCLILKQAALAVSA